MKFTNEELDTIKSALMVAASVYLADIRAYKSRYDKLADDFAVQSREQCAAVDDLVDRIDAETSR